MDATSTAEAEPAAAWLAPSATLDNGLGGRDMGGIELEPEAKGLAHELCCTCIPGFALFRETAGR